MTEYNYPYYISPNDGTFSMIKDDIAFYIKKDTEFHFPFERHDGYEIYLFREGDAQIFIEQNSFRLSRGDLYMILPEAYHRVQAVPPSTYDRSVMHISSKYMAKLSSDKTNLCNAFQFHKGDSCNVAHLNEKEIEDFTEKMKQIRFYYESNDFGSDLRFQSTITEFLLNLYHRFQNPEPKQHSLTPPLIEQAIEYIQTHLSEDLTIDELSHALYHDRSYISRLFKEFTGITLQQYIIIKKLTYAKQLLEQGLSLNDVCFQSGFRNYANFIRTFSKNVGTSPAKYQKQFFEKKE